MKRPLLWDDQGKKRENSNGGSTKHNTQQYVPPPKASGGVNGASTVPWAQRPAQAVIQNGGTHSQRWRIALYSPGIVGLGHMRRNLLIAQTLAASPLQPVILMIAESREGGTFAMPPGMDCLTLPALRKGAVGVLAAQPARETNRIDGFHAHGTASHRHVVGAGGLTLARMF